MREVAAEILFAMQIDVERNEIEKTQIEIFRRRIVRIGKKRVGFDLLSQVVEFAKKATDRARPMPSHNIRANLVADAVSRNSLAKLAHLCDRLSDRVANVAHHVARVEKRHVMRPWNSNHQTKAGLARRLEHPQRRRNVEANQVGAELAHQRKIGGGALGLGVSLTARVRRERPVRNAANVKFFRTLEEVFPTCDETTHAR